MSTCLRDERAGFLCGHSPLPRGVISASIRRLLEMLDTHLWTPENHALNPQLQQLQRYELGQEGVPSPEFLEGDADARLLALSGGPDQRDSLEEPLTHWGTITPVHTSTCAVCALALADDVPLSIYACGHTLHTSCVSEQDGEYDRVRSFFILFFWGGRESEPVGPGSPEGIVNGPPSSPSEPWVHDFGPPSFLPCHCLISP